MLLMTSVSPGLLFAQALIDRTFKILARLFPMIGLTGTPNSRKARICRYRFFERLWTRCNNNFFHDLAMNSAGEGIVPFMGMPLPAVQHNYKKEMYGEIAVFYEIAVHFPQFKLVVRGRLKPLSYSREVSHLQVRPHFAARPKLTTRSRSIGARP